jgi:adenylate cyclase
VRLTDAASVREWPGLAELAAQGSPTFLAAPFVFMLNGEVHGITYMTREPGGYSEQDIADLAHVMRPLTRG